MFAHQVIEDKKKYFNKPIIPIEDEKGEIIEYINNPDINGAVCFSLPPFHELLNLAKIQSDGSEDWSIFNATYIKPPYRKVWIDGHYSEEWCKAQKEPEDLLMYDTAFCDKWGILITDMGKYEEKYTHILSVISYYHFKQQKRWLMAPHWYLLMIKEDKIEFKGCWLDIYDLISDIDPKERMHIPGCFDGVYVALAFMKLINCKNISTELIKAPEALNKKRRRNNKQEIFDYHVLTVATPNSKETYREKIEPLFHNRLHLCRGHFKEYTKEHPLFGKLTGLYWWQPHVRGQNHNGIVIKDYEVKRAIAV